MYKLFKRYIGHVSVIVIFFGAFAWLIRLEAKADEGVKQSMLNKQLLLEVSKTANTAHSNLDLMLRLGAISKGMYEDLRKLPTTPVDVDGNPYNEWYLVGEDAIYIIQVPDSCTATILEVPIGLQGDR